MGRPGVIHTFLEVGVTGPQTTGAESGEEMGLPEKIRGDGSRVSS